MDQETGEVEVKSTENDGRWQRWADFVASLEAAKLTSIGQDGKRQYAYAPLQEVVRVVVAAARDHGFAVVQSVYAQTESSQSHAVGTRILDANTGEEMASAMVAVPGGLKPKELGSWITYARRYTLSAAACVVTEPDDDADAAQASTAAPQRTAAAKPSSAQHGSAAREVDLPAGSFTVAPKTITVLKEGNGWTLYGVETDQGSFRTFDSDVVATCDTAVKASRKVTVTLVEKRGRVAATGAVLEDGGDVPPAERGQDDIPF